MQSALELEVSSLPTVGVAAAVRADGKTAGRVLAGGGSDSLWPWRCRLGAFHS